MLDPNSLASKNKPVLRSDDPHAVAEYMLALGRWARSPGRAGNLPSATKTGA